MLIFPLISTYQLLNELYLNELSVWMQILILKTLINNFKSAAGQAEHDTAQAKGWVEGATDSVVGTTKQLYGQAVGDKTTEAEGRAQATGL